MKVSLLSNQTNSLDPLAVHSRIFVGNLNTFQCSKSDVEQIFQRYGQLTAISMHKGYAFVQFSNPVEAKNAADGEDGRLVLNQNIDVNLVSQPKLHQQKQQLQHQVTTKHVFQASSGGLSNSSSSSNVPTTGNLRHQSMYSTTSSSPTAGALKLSASCLQHLISNGALSSSSGVVVQPNLSVSIHKRRKRRRHLLNRMVNNNHNNSSTELLLDSRMLMPNSNHQHHHQHYSSGISPTLSLSSSSSTSSNESLGNSLTEYTNNFRGAAAAAGQSQQTLPHQPHWYPFYQPNINNNYLIPTTAVYDNHPNEVIDDAVGPQQQQRQLPSPPGVCTLNPTTITGGVIEDESQEVMLYDGNNNPVSSWEEFIQTTNKRSGGGAGYPPDRGDILICGNCRELFNGLGKLLEHRRTNCQLRVICECRKTTTIVAPPEEDNTTLLLCRMCREQFSHPMALLQHVQHVHQIKIFETEHDYTPDKDLVAGGTSISPREQNISSDSTSSETMMMPVEELSSSSSSNGSPSLPMQRAMSGN